MKYEVTFVSHVTKYDVTFVSPFIKYEVTFVSPVIKYDVTFVSTTRSRDRYDRSSPLDTDNNISAVNSP
jgi:hypothetical protein